ncbi:MULTISPECIES: ATP synthase F1 subunit gamma [Thermoflexus]|uniref:ATP synthase gamma chain n=1 Tax=Thermoflexus hugenholtzii JAD2 TaxID=877466 RepID=A0A212PZX0_9CHLR|nr:MULTISPECIES: ATP synthase F1 subunit gamma [Thermoflexus]QWK11477.1 MAG: ATP synthase F1 subunit gamma [Thermoflexus hugenholtzii]SNB52488.1 ATP synthase F1 subcomplex gamma subunit [Thermoflexus hugenholtzii JAD2]
MPTLRELRRRIRTVRSISQITRAMEAVSASKMRRAQEMTLASRPYSQKAWEVLVHLAHQAEASALLHPLLEVRPVHRVLLVLITADRGLCGAYNDNIIRLAFRFAAVSRAPVAFLTVGRKGRDAVARVRGALIADFSPMPRWPRFADVRPIARLAMEEFLKGSVDEVYVAYTDFINTMVQRPRVRRLLPLRLTGAYEPAVPEAVERLDTRAVANKTFIYEPDPAQLLEVILPRFVELQLYQAVLESLASEHSARMVAMRNATENAENLIYTLTLSYNKARQQSITSEMLDIAGGAEAMRQAARAQIQARVRTPAGR